VTEGRNGTGERGKKKENKKKTQFVNKDGVRRNDQESKNKKTEKAGRRSGQTAPGHLIDEKREKLEDHAKHLPKEAGNRRKD